MRTYTLSGASQAIPIPLAPFIYYRGFSIRETAGAVAIIRVWDNTSATGNLLDTISFIAAQSVRECYGLPKIAKIGLYVQVVSGTIEGSINFD